MWKVVFLSALAVAASGAVPNRRALTPMDAFSLQSFTALFRETLLNKVAVEWNVTVDQSHQLQQLMIPCKSAISSTTANCQSCAQSQCQTSPSFSDYLNLANPYTYLKKPLNEMAGSLGDVVDLLGDKGDAFLTSMSDLASSTGHSIAGGFTDAVNGLKDGFNKIGDGFKDAGNTVIDTGSLIGNGVVDVGHSLTDGLTDAGHALEHAGSSIVHSIGSIFGKRAIDPQARACMSKCSSCHALLLDNQQSTIKEICGDNVVQLNNTINSRVEFITGIYNATIDKVHPIVQKLEFDPTSMNAKMQLTNVYVTVYMKGQVVRYKSGVPYSMMNIPQTALDMALEYWTMFGKH